MDASDDAQFEIISFTADSLYEALSNSAFGPREVKEQPRACYLFNYLQKFPAKTIVIEKRYTDGEYLDDFAAYYVRCFADYERRCKRLHFFRTSVSPQDLAAAIGGTKRDLEHSSLRDAYLGFVVARPLPGAVVGRTVLAIHETAGDHYTSVRQYDANLFGVDLSIEKTLAFQEQDSVVAACATVALWCCFQKTGRLFDTPVPTRAMITRTATQSSHLGRPIPSHGLNILEICNAVRHFGLDPDVIPVTPNLPLASLLRGYLNLGLPIILGVEIGDEKPEEPPVRHAIALVGYSLPYNTPPRQEVADPTKCVPMIGRRVQSFIVHDDQIGPFSRLDVYATTKVGNTAYPVYFKGAWISPSGGRLPIYPSRVVIPLYSKIRLTFQDVQRLLIPLHPVMRLFLPGADLEWDIHLTTTNQYKNEVRSAGALKEETLGHLLVRPHPRFIWRALMRFKNSDVLELLVDATSFARAFPIYEVIWHRPELGVIVKELLQAPPTSLKKILSERFREFLITNT